MSAGIVGGARTAVKDPLVLPPSRPDHGGPMRDDAASVSVAGLHLNDFPLVRREWDPSNIKDPDRRVPAYPGLRGSKSSRERARLVQIRTHWGPVEDPSSAPAIVIPRRVGAVVPGDENF